jgi:hypothetical protein
MNGELDRAASDLAAALVTHSQRVEDGLLFVTSALNRATDRLASALTLAGPAVPGPPSPVAPVPTVVTGTVQVVNEASVPLVVTVAGPTAPPEPTRPAGAATVLAVPPPAAPPVAAVPETVTREVAERTTRELDTVSTRVVDTTAALTQRVEAAGAPTPAVFVSEAGAPALQVVSVAQSLVAQQTQPRLPGQVPLAPATQEPTPGLVIPPPSPQPAPVAPAAPPPAPAAPPTPAPEAPADRVLRVPESAPAAPAGEGGFEITFNGGISVEITAEAIDVEHAEETARAIAEEVLEEIERLIERDRFRSGLPTAMTA